MCYTGSAGCLPTLLFNMECGADKEGSEGGGMGAMEVSEEMKGDCCNQITADHQHITLCRKGAASILCIESWLT